MNDYQKFVAKLFKCCEIPDEYPNAPVLIDTNTISDVLEEEFIKVGLLEVQEDED